MSAFAFFGALELGLLYGLVALGVYLTFRVLDFPDLSVDGSFPMALRWRLLRLWQELIHGWRQDWPFLLAPLPVGSRLF